MNGTCPHEGCDLPLGHMGLAKPSGEVPDRYDYLGFTFVEGERIDGGRNEYEVYRGIAHIATAVRDEYDPDGPAKWGLKMVLNRQGPITWYPSRLALVNYLKETLR